MADLSARQEQVRLVEALLFAADRPLELSAFAARLPEGTEVEGILRDIQEIYRERGVNLVQVGGKWALRTAPDLSARMQIERPVRRRLSRAAVETLAIIAYHQPVTRSEIEEIRGVSQSRGTLDVLFEAGWIRPGRRRRTPGRPVTWLTSEGFLEQFGLSGLDELPGIDELKAAGLLDTRPALNIYLERGDGQDSEAEETAATGATGGSGDSGETLEEEGAGGLGDVPATGETLEVSDLQSALVELEDGQDHGPGPAGSAGDS